MAKTEPAVFISYKSEESAEADKVRRALETSGISCWMAPESIPGGRSYAEVIPAAIRRCSVFVLILTEKSQSSQWVKRELDRAINEGKRVMPFILENTRLDDDIAFYLTNVQQYFAYKDWEKELSRMIDDICALLGITRIVPPPVPTGGGTPSKAEEQDKIPVKKRVPRTKKKSVTPHKNKRHKRLYITLAVVLAAVALMFSVSVGMYLSSTVEICGRRYDRKSTVLTLTDEYISASSLRNISELERLYVLSMTRCRFDDEIGSLSSIPAARLRELTLSECGLTDELFDSMQLQDARMEVLDISGNQGVTKPSMLWKLEKLKQLTIDGCSFTDLNLLRQCIYLEQLSARNCGITDIGGLSNTTLLRSLNLSGNALTEVTGLENTAAKVERLYLSGNRLESVEFAEKMPNLEYLDISDNRVRSIDALYGCKMLKCVDAARNKIEEADGEKLSDMLSYVDFSGNGMKRLANKLRFNSKLGILCLNLADNRLTEVSFEDSEDGRIDYVNLHGNDIEDLTTVYQTTPIRYLVLDYRKEYDYAKLSDQVTIKLWLADCPLSERISIENTFASRVVFLSSKDLEDCADADIKTAAGSKLWKAVKGTESDTNP